VIQETSAKILDELLPEERRAPAAQERDQTSPTIPQTPTTSPEESISLDR